MTGAEVPDAWQGGLPFRYRLTGGDELQVRLHVEQPRSIKKTANVIATIPGATRPDELVIVGCHHDAWVMGATDPLCGTIVLLETARLIAQRAKEGHPPDRTIIFAAWGAEEWGIIGSSEWVEANEARLRDHAVLYVNLDVASMGLDFSASASPMIRALITKAAAATPSPRDPAKTVLDAWRDRTPAEHWSPPFGDMGGGSDHVGFLCRTGVSSCGLSSSGGRGFSYHSAYDSLPWYWRAVGPGYESAVMQTGVTNEIATHAANDPILPYEPGDVFRDLVAHLDTVIAKAPAAFKDADAAVSRLKLLRASAASLAEKADATMTAVRAAPAATHDTLNAILRRLDRVWLEHDGLPERAWFRNVYSSPDENAGYAPWTLPLLMRALDRHDAAELDAAADRYQRATQRASSILGDLAAAAGQR